MPSEKLKDYSNDPCSPVVQEQLKTHLKSFSQEHLIEIIWLGAQYDTVLWKALSASIGMRLARGNWEETIKAIDCALYFPGFINYTEERYGIIIDQMIDALDFLYKECDKQFTLKIATYIFEQAQNLFENFEDGWNWICALTDLENWMNEKIGETKHE